ncbi:MAG TPA: glutathione S-transferase, partial [Pseudomonadota bacterium]|nr:glutathione S-transferase [Pseudomonadota bacterium]
GLEYEVRRYERDPRTMLAPTELRSVHPLGKSPVIEDQGRVLAESGAILEYLVERHGQGRLRPPADSEQRLRYLYWMHYAEGSAMPPLLMKLVFDRIGRAPMPFFAKPIAKSIVGNVLRTFVLPQLKQHLDYMEGELGKASWFAGEEFSAADIQMSFPLEAAAKCAGLDARSRPKLWDFLQRIHGRPAYQRALERGGRYELMG